MIKISQKRRETETICATKLEEANVVLDNFKQELVDVRRKRLSNEE